MKLHRLSPSVLLLFPAISTAVNNPTPANRASNEPSIAPLQATNSNAVLSEKYGLGPNVVAKGTLDVPVDGQDGRPHAGPWVETSAERDRKKTGTGNTQDGKPNVVASASASALGHLGPDGMPYPHSNDGVMDDRNRHGPKEGTRGTEGGVSEKQKNQMSAEKVPGGPKEAPPLPQSEQRKLPTNEYTVGKGTHGYDSAANLGVLEVLPRSLFMIVADDIETV